MGGDSEFLSIRRCPGFRCTDFACLPGNLFPFPLPGSDFSDLDYKWGEAWALLASGFIVDWASPRSFTRNFFGLANKTGELDLILAIPFLAVGVLELSLLGIKCKGLVSS